MYNEYYLLDTNILIYHTKGESEIRSFLKNISLNGELNISIITKIEFLGWNKHTPDGLKKCKRLIQNTRVFSVNEGVADKAIEIRQGKKIKLPDAVIAATALLNNLTLVTRNVDDFKDVEDLLIHNPFKKG
jgi:predicted nucleic acid-binding protein